MQSIVPSMCCPACRTGLVDVEDEFVCPSCGVVSDKEVIETPGSAVQAATLGCQGQALGSYLGSFNPTARERASKGFSKSNSTYGYLKVISDRAGREDGPVSECTRLVERVGEKLSLPTFVVSQAAAFVRKLLLAKEKGHGVTLAAVSAYALDCSCRLSGVASVTTRDVVEAHRALGKRVKMSSLMRLALDSQVKVRSRSPEDFLGRVLAKLSQMPELASESGRHGKNATQYLMSLRSLAAQILSRVEESQKAGHRPSALAATAVYAADFVMAKREGREKRVTQRDVAECGDTAEYTVREQFREIFAPVLSSLVIAPASPTVALPLP